jgi:hypothetical protein
VVEFWNITVVSNGSFNLGQSTINVAAAEQFNGFFQQFLNHSVHLQSAVVNMAFQGSLGAR